MMGQFGASKRDSRWPGNLQPATVGKCWYAFTLFWNKQKQNNENLVATKIYGQQWGNVYMQLRFFKWTNCNISTTNISKKYILKMLMFIWIYAFWTKQENYENVVSNLPPKILS